MINLDKLAPVDFGFVASMRLYLGARHFIPACYWNIAGRTGVLKGWNDAIGGQVPVRRLVEKAHWLDLPFGSHSARYLFGPGPSIWRDQRPAVRQAIVTGLELRSSGGEDHRKILPKLSFRKDGMAVV